MIISFFAAVHPIVLVAAAVLVVALLILSRRQCGGPAPARRQSAGPAQQIAAADPAAAGALVAGYGVRAKPAAGGITVGGAQAGFARYLLDRGKEAPAYRVARPARPQLRHPAAHRLQPPRPALTGTVLPAAPRPALAPPPPPVLDLRPGSPPPPALPERSSAAGR